MGGRRQPRVSLGIAAFTDWHVGLRDEYDVLGRTRRVRQPLHAYRRCFGEVLKAIGDAGHLLLWFGGDLIHGRLRAGDDTRCSLTPSAQIEAALGLCGTIFTALPRRSFSVAYSYGNHGRSTHVPELGDERRGHFETRIVRALQHATAQRGGTWLGSNAARRVYRVAGWRVGVQHGHHIRGRGTLTGILSSLLEQRAAEPAAIDLLGHFHRPAWFDGVVLCASVAAYDEVARSLGYGPTPRAQTAVMLHPSGQMGVQVIRMVEG